MSAPHEFLADLALVLGTAAVTTVLFRKLRQPVVLGYLLAGLIVGPYVPVPLVADPERIATLAELGVILVMFSIGLEFSVRRLLSVLPTAGIAGLIQIAGMLWLGTLVGRAFGWDLKTSVFAGAALSISSTMIVAKVFSEQRVGGTLAELAYGILIIEDLAAVVMLALLSAWASGSALPQGEILRSVATLLAFLAGMIGLGFLIVPRAIRFVARLRSPETLLVASIGLCFLLALLAQRVGYSVALGAFLAGSLVAESGREKKVAELVGPVRDVFAAMFFVAVGMMVDPRVVLAHWGEVLALTAVVVAGNALFVTVGSFLAGYDVRTSLRAGLSLAQVGEFSFIIAGVGLAAGAVDPALMPIIVAVAVVTTFVTPYLVRGSQAIALALDRRLPHSVQNFVSLYGSWLEKLRTSFGRRSKERRLAFILALDGALLTAVVIVSRLAYEPLVLRLVEGVGLTERLSKFLLVGVAVALEATLVFGLVRSSRKLANLLALRALPEGGGTDFSAAPRRSLIVTLQLGLVLAVLVPAAALTQPFVPMLAPAPALFVVMAMLGFAFWRSARELQEHTKAGAQILLDALTAGAAAPAALTAGIGSPEAVRVEGGSFCNGRSLKQLDLRGLTGATVIGIRRDGEDIVSPGGRETLQEGDLLALAGSHEAVEEARKLLERPSS